MGSILSDHNEAFQCADSSGTFEIEEHTGTLRVTRALVVWCQYNVTIRALDHGNPPLFSIISIQIETWGRNATELRAPATVEVMSPGL